MATNATDDVSTWTLPHLTAFVSNQIQESHTLDYKRSAALARTDRARKELSKDVSAFANSSGGTIIYGIEETEHLPTALDAGADPSEISREWLEQTIDANIRPRIPGVKVAMILNGAGRAFFAVSIPQSTWAAPHQANDGRYYRRGNFKSEPMFDYEVRDLMRRGTTPQLYLRLVLQRRPQGHGGCSVRMIVQIGNATATPALYSHIQFFFDPRLRVVPSPLFEKVEGDIQMPDGAFVPTTTYTRNLAVPADQPVYREAEWALGFFHLTLPDVDRYDLGFNIHCPGFRDGRSGFIQVDDNEIGAILHLDTALEGARLSPE